MQSVEWRKFQESVGRKTYNIFYPHPPFGHPLPQAGEGDICFWANIIEHKLLVVGKYFYIPRGPILENQNVKIKNQNDNAKCKIFLDNLINLAEENKAGWIRIDPANEEVLELIKENVNYKTVKAPHDMQPREILVIDITKPQEQLLSEMKSKTRYNIKLAEKKEVRIKKQEVSGEYIDEFMRLTKIMAKRKGIIAHPESYYKKMIEIIPENMLKLYVAEYEGKIVASNLVAFYGNTCTYLHGASDDDYKNVMAPYLLQWRQIQDARIAGCGKYDFGGISTNYESSANIRITNKWAGITRFKLGFAPNTKTIEFPGSYDMIVSPVKYKIYRIIQKIKSII